VRLLAVENCVALGKLLSAEDAHAAVLPATRSAASDKSWRVRYVVAEHFLVLCDALGPAVTRSELVGALVKLLRDHEPEVRTAAALQCTAICERLVGGGGEGAPSEAGLAQVVELVMPCVAELCADASQHVRAAMASVIMGLAPLLGKSLTIELLLPLVLTLLRDEYPEVRLNVISRLHAVNTVIGVELLAQSLLPSVMQLAEDRQWRVRLAIIDYLPLLAHQARAQPHAPRGRGRGEARAAGRQVPRGRLRPPRTHAQLTLPPRAVPPRVSRAASPAPRRPRARCVALPRSG
jgi:serine/threonine-protein phosphatase 2A regulatory subunit A